MRDLAEKIADVAAALEELRAKLDSMMFNERHATPFEALQKAQAELRATIVKLGLRSTEKCFDCGASQVADTCPECGKSFCAVCVEKDESCCDPEQQLKIRTELARRMGWTVRETVPGITRIWFNPEGVYSCMPDPFTRAEDKDALVAWLAEDRDLQIRFTKQLMRQLKDAQGYTLLETHERGNDDYCDWFQFLTAPRETITLAVARALEITEASE